MSERRLPLVSISLVTYNGLRWLDACLSSTLELAYPEIELIILDNASTDGTLEHLRAFSEHRDFVTLISSTTNLGFAAAHNRNIRIARGTFICLLNQDVVLDSDFLAQVVRGFEESPGTGAVQGKLYRLGPDLVRTDTFDTTGLRMLRNRRIVSRGQGQKDQGQYDRTENIFGADGPAPVFRAAALRDVRVPRRQGEWEVLDEDFFMYKEDVDLAWRLQLFGWDALYLPSAMAWHARGAAGSGETALSAARERRHVPAWIKSVSWGNQRLMQVKNELGPLFRRDVLPILWKELRALAFLAVFETRSLTGVPRLVRSLPAARRKRAYIMKHRRRSASEMASWFGGR